LTNVLASTSPIAAMRPAPQFQTLMFFGFVAALMTLLCFIHQRQSRSAVLALAVCLAAMALYTFMQGAWPVGIVQVVWSAATFARWRRFRKTGRLYFA